MFEKEAEEFERRKHYRYEDNDYCGDIADGIIQAYQQGAEFGYNKAKEKVSYLEDNLRVARKDRKNLQIKVGKGLKEFIKDCPYSALKLYANGYYVKQLAKAKEIIQKFLEFDPEYPQEHTDLNELCEKAEQFISEVVK